MRPGSKVTLVARAWPYERLPVKGEHLRTEVGACYRVEQVDSDSTPVKFVCTRLYKDAVQEGPGVFLWRPVPVPQ